ncbi:MAG TPA: sulfatase-like hydrolase/transferase [Thermoanaerobaculia bacterium]|jgi:arylsulfatase A-like enzyme/Flp pilus assembly protein TadD|nr:sulfatase-like hydrolase/transferase [Thermoanaerobaculia bacterium]
MKRILITIALPVILAGCNKGGGGTSQMPDVPKGTPVVLISIDTLRADHLPAYGYEGVETPALDALRKDAILYERAYSVTPLTFPSHSTLLTGLLPAQHGVRDNVGYRLDEGKIESGELPFLPEILKKAGYATGGAVSAYVLQGKTGLKTGFDVYEDGIEFRSGTGLGALQRPGDETLKRARPWLESVKDKPFFFFFHIYEPHTPYAPPEPWASKYASKYDGEIASADQIVGDLINELKRMGVYDKALVVLLSDHGEGLGDHGEDEHGVFLYNESIHVPLLVKLPEGQKAGGTTGRPVELLDVAPTVLALLGMDVPKAMTGVSLLAEDTGNVPPRRIYSETFYPRLHFGWSELFSLIDETHHYIDSPEPELYDRVKDPKETANVLTQERRVYAALKKELSGFDRQLVAPAAVDEETRQAMNALGYIGAGAGGAAEGPLPPPRSKISSLADLKEGFRLNGLKDYPGAEAAFRRVIAANPKMVDAWEFLGHTLEKAGRSREALEAYREGLKVSNGSPQIAVAAASLFLNLGQLEEAETHAKMAVVTHPSFAHGLLAQIALERDQLDVAEREARAAMEDQSLRVGPMITLAEILHARKDDTRALDLVRQAEEAYNQREAKDPDLIRGLNVIRGKILADQGDATGAEAAFRKEIELFPDNIRAYSSLAILYALSGRGNEVGAVLQRMVAASPTPAAYAEAVKTLRILNDPNSAASLLRYAMGRYPGDPGLRKLAAGG